MSNKKTFELAFLPTSCDMAFEKRSAKELVCIAIDVSPTMHADLPLVAASVTELLHKKLLFGKKGAFQSALLLSGSNRAEGPQTGAAPALTPGTQKLTTT